MKSYKMFMSDGRSYTVTKNEREAMLQKSKTTGGHFPYFLLRDSDIIIFFKYITGFEPQSVDSEDEYCSSSFGETSPEVERAEELISNVFEEKEDESVVVEDKRKAALQELMEKSSCVHEKTDLHYISTLSSRGKETKRYFPVCSFCGQRLRFLKAEDLSEDEKINAKAWVES